MNNTNLLRRALDVLGNVCYQNHDEQLKIVELMEDLRTATERDDICGFCGLPGANKIPHPIRWPDESSAGTEFVHAACEDAECARASALINGKARDEFLRNC